MIKERVTLRRRLSCCIGLSLMILLVWTPLLMGLAAAVDSSRKNIPEQYSDWFFAMLSFVHVIVWKNGKKESL